MQLKNEGILCMKIYNVIIAKIADENDVESIHPLDLIINHYDCLENARKALKSNIEFFITDAFIENSGTIKHISEDNVIISDEEATVQFMIVESEL